MPYATRDDVELYFEVHGESGPVIVFAHGAGGNATSWWQQVPEFSATHRVVVFDHRGFARSPTTNGSVLEFEDDLVAVMDAAEVDSATLVCQSMGGWTGVRAAVHHTNRVDGVILANTPGAVFNDVVEANMSALGERIARTGLVNAAISAEFAQRNPAGALLYQQISAYNVNARPDVSDEAVYLPPEIVKQSGVRFWVVSSDLDPLFPPEVLESVAQDIDAPCIRVNGAGHSTYFEKPEAFNAIVSEFLRTA